MLKNKFKFAVTVLGFVSLALCNSAYSDNVEKGKTKFATLCASCHGQNGKGDGPIALSLPPESKPADLSGALKFASDLNKFKELLEKGGAAVGLSALMPPQAGMSEEDIGNLWAFIQSLKK